MSERYQRPSERFSDYAADSGVLLFEQYAGEEPNVGERWKYYDLATSPIDFEHEILSLLDLDADAIVADVGCERATLLQDMRLRYRHRGALIGVDLYPEKLAAVSQELNDLGAEGIHFIAGNAKELPLKTDSLDALFCLFMLYHLEDPREGLSEIRRTVKPGGKILISTSGKTNKRRHREIEMEIASYLGIKPPPIFTSSFNSIIAAEELPKWFQVQGRIRQAGWAKIKSQSGYEIYRNSLATMRSTFSPAPSDEQWDDAIRNVLVPAINYDIDQQPMYDGSGTLQPRYFRDTVERDFFICVNNEPHTG
ncbi:MAG: methyltransferase domain-containing protein [Candidatus Saccharimonadales bacterium]